MPTTKGSFFFHHRRSIRLFLNQIWTFVHRQMRLISFHECRISAEACSGISWRWNAQLSLLLFAPLAAPWQTAGLRADDWADQREGSFCVSDLSEPTAGERSVSLGHQSGFVNFLYTASQLLSPPPPPPTHPTPTLQQSFLMRKSGDWDDSEKTARGWMLSDLYL